MRGRSKNYSRYGDIYKAPEEKKPTYECLDIQTMDHRHSVLKDNLIVCIDLYASWCGPCKRVAPVYAEMARKYNAPGKCLLAKEDIDLGLTEKTGDMQVGGVPAFIFYFKGKIVMNGKEPLVVTGFDQRKVEETIEQLISLL